MHMPECLRSCPGRHNPALMFDGNTRKCWAKKLLRSATASNTHKLAGDNTANPIAGAAYANIEDGGRADDAGDEADDYNDSGDNSDGGRVDDAGDEADDYND